jgi:hypothetical protein
MRFRETLHPTKPTIVWFKIMRFSNGGGGDVMKVNVIPKFFIFLSHVKPKIKLEKNGLQSFSCNL